MSDQNIESSAAPTSASSYGHSVYGAPNSGRGKKKRTLGSWLWPAAIIIVVAGGVWYIIANNQATPTVQSGGGGRRGGGGFGGGPTPVGAMSAAKGDMPVYLNALGTVTPTATVTVHTLISGVLQTVGFTEGQIVSKGQFLAQVDPRPYQAALAQAEGALARDQAQLAGARIDLKRYKTLVAEDSVSSQTLDTQVALVGQLEGTVKSDQAAVDTQKLNLIYAHITAPISGRVGLRQVDAGNYVTPSDANGIVAITEQSPIDVSFSIPEDNIQRVVKRFSSGAKLQVTLFDRAQTTQLADGQLFSLDNLIDTTTGTLRAKARFSNANGALFPSQFVNVRLLVDTLHNVVIVPSSSILRGQQGLFVYVVDAKGAAHVRPVQVGPAAGEKTAITSGVNAGEEVVTDGTDRLRDGACVVLPGASGGGWGGHGGKGAQTPKPSGGFLGLFGGAPKAKPGAFAGAGCGGGGSASAWSGKAGGASAWSSAGTSEAPASGSGAPHSRHGGKPEDGAMAAGPADTAPQAEATAAGGGQGQWQGGGGGGGRTQAMLEQLNLSPDQKAKADAIFAKAREKAQTSDDPDARRTAFKEAADQLDSILRPDQKAKLQQLRADMASHGGAQGPGRP